MNATRFMPLNQLFDLAANKTLKLAIESEMTVLLTGPTGCGKSHLAQWIHCQSVRKEKSFVSINLATLHEETLESELFGHERGAFTGADQKKIGLLEMAHGGTVFLDEISEIPSKLQARLLEFLQSKTILPLGARRSIQIDARVIAASNRDLQREVQIGNFREDLYFRLRVLWLKLKELNEMGEAFGEVVHTLLEELCAQKGVKLKRLTAEFVEAIERYPWPGNIRELKNVLETALASAPEETLGVESLPDWFHRKDEPGEKEDLDCHRLEVPLLKDYHRGLARYEELYLAEMLKRCRGKVNLLSRTIGLNKGTLIKRLRAYQLKLTPVDSEVGKRFLA